MIKKISAITSVFLILCVSTFYSCQKKEPVTSSTPPSEILYTMPSEETTHEGTWLSWPHQYQFGLTYRNRLDATWVEMTKSFISIIFFSSNNGIFSLMQVKRYSLQSPK